jgi:hypothetical protein
VRKLKIQIINNILFNLEEQFAKWQSVMGLEIFKKLCNQRKRKSALIFMFKLWHALGDALEEVGKSDMRELKISK